MPEKLIGPRMRNLILREEWDARPPREVTVMRLAKILYLVVHYSAAGPDEQADHRKCAERVRGIQRFHMDTRGWFDIAYNWLVCKHGYVFQGRGIRARSAATGPANGYTVAACFLGDDTKGRDDVTVKGRAALHEVGVFVHRNARNARGYRGHRDFMQTTCPGDELYAWVKRQPEWDA